MHRRSAAYPGGDPFPLNLNKNFIFPNNGTYTTYPMNVPTYLEQWNFSIQKQLGSNWLVTANYLGNHTVHLWADAPINAPEFIPGNCVAGQYGLTAPGACSTTANQNFRRPLYLENPTQGQFYGTVHRSTPGRPPVIRRSCFRRSIVWPTTSRCWATIRGRTALPAPSHRRWMEPSTPIQITGPSTRAIARASITERSSIFPRWRNRRSSPSDGWRPLPETGSCRRSCKCNPAATSQ